MKGKMTYQAPKDELSFRCTSAERFRQIPVKLRIVVY